MKTLVESIIDAADQNPAIPYMNKEDYIAHKRNQTQDLIGAELAEVIERVFVGICDTKKLTDFFITFFHLLEGGKLSIWTGHLSRWMGCEKDESLAIKHRLRHYKFIKVVGKTYIPEIGMHAHHYGFGDLFVALLEEKNNPDKKIVMFPQKAQKKRVSKK